MLTPGHAGDCVCSNPAVAPEAVPAAGGEAVIFRVSSMDCATEAALIRNRLRLLDGVSGLDIDVVNRTVTVHHRLESLVPIEAAFQSIGMRAQRVHTATRHGGEATEPPEVTRWAHLLISGACAAAAEAVHWISGGDYWVIVALALVSVVAGGFPTYMKGWIALRNRNLNMNSLMSIAVTGAILVGH